MLIITNTKIGLTKSSIRIKGINTYTNIPRKYERVDARSIFAEYFSNYKKKLKLLEVD